MDRKLQSENHIEFPFNHPDPGLDSWGKFEMDVFKKILDVSTF